MVQITHMLKKSKKEEDKKLLFSLRPKTQTKILLAISSSTLKYCSMIFYLLFYFAEPLSISIPHKYI